VTARVVHQSKWIFLAAELRLCCGATNHKAVLCCTWYEASGPAGLASWPGAGRRPPGWPRSAGQRHIVLFACRAPCGLAKLRS